MLAILRSVRGEDVGPSWYMLAILLSVLGLLLPSKGLDIFVCPGLVGESGGWMSISGTWIHILDLRLFQI